MRLLAGLIVLALLSAAAHAAEATISLGDAHVRYDDTRWRALPSADRVRFEPQGAIERKLDPVELHIADHTASCADLAAAAFGIGLYDLNAFVSAPWTIGSVTGEHFAVRTRCRNATPTGVVGCVKVAGRTYILQAVQAGCTGHNLFSGIDPLTEIAGGISFSSKKP